VTGEAFLAAGFLLGLLVIAALALRDRRRRQGGELVGDPADSFYHPYTTEFDLVCAGSDLVAELALKAVDARPAQAVGSLDRAERLEQFEQAHAGACVAMAQPRNLNGAAVCILLDQSGSMAERMPLIAGELLSAIEALETGGAATMLAGYTTVGWKGGRSRQQWIAAGRPPYPGRLCDLLHIIYSDFSQTTTAAAVATLLQPAVCFENVDGEAIVWAEQQLLGVPQARRCLIVVSDGAPVDDSSLAANGPNFLWNHLDQVVGDCLERGEIVLGAVGIDHRLDSLFPTSRVISDDGGLASVIVELAVELVTADQTGTNAPGKSTNPS